MTVYKYEIPAFGTADGMPNFTATMLDEKLRNGKESLLNYYVFQSEERALKAVSFDMDASENVVTINLFTTEELLSGMEDDLIECVQKNLAEIAWENYDDVHSCIILDGNIEDMNIVPESELKDEWAEEVEDDFTAALEAMEELPYEVSI